MASYVCTVVDGVRYFPELFWDAPWLSMLGIVIGFAVNRALGNKKANLDALLKVGFLVSLGLVIVVSPFRNIADIGRCGAFGEKSIFESAAPLEPVVVAEAAEVKGEPGTPPEKKSGTQELLEDNALYHYFFGEEASLVSVLLGLLLSSVLLMLITQWFSVFPILAAEAFHERVFPLGLTLSVFLFYMIFWSIGLTIV
ncbi:MAG: hypothetical protein HQL52_04955 [Magnetococcales bacterium]|nr:hypothetical protein [Magnetococcales bacterium]